MSDIPTSVIKDAVKASKKAFIYAGIFSIFVNILMLTVPIYMLQLFDRVLASRSGETLFYLTLIAIIVLVIFGLLDMVRSRILVRVSSWLDEFVSPYALLRSADDVLQGNTYGPIALRDIATIRSFLSSPSIFSLFDSPWVPLYLIVIFMLHFYLGLLATGGAIILFTIAILNELLTRIPLRNANNQARANQMNTEIALRNAEAIQAMGMMTNLMRRWHEKNKKVSHLQTLASERSSVLLSTSKFVRMSLQLLMLGLGAYLVINDQLTAGMMIAGSILLSRALAPVEQAIGMWKQLVAARGAYNRLCQHFKTGMNRSAGIELPEPVGLLQFSNVTYLPPRSPKPTLSNITFTLKPGGMLAIIGPAASGKTTVARLAVGAWPPRSGDVRLDGAQVFTWERDDFGTHVGYLPQDIELFPGTVKENIARMGDPNDELVIQAAKISGVHEMILALPSGYDTVLGDEGYKLSGGQRQRIALARAIYGYPKLIILDEPNSNLDHDGELALVKALTELRQRNCAILLITHRPNIVRIVDDIMVLKQGMIQMYGPRDDVMKQLQQMAEVAKDQGDTGKKNNGSPHST